MQIAPWVPCENNNLETIKKRVVPKPGNGLDLSLICYFVKSGYETRRNNEETVKRFLRDKLQLQCVALPMFIQPLPFMNLPPLVNSFLVDTVTMIYRRPK